MQPSLLRTTAFRRVCWSPVFRRMSSTINRPSPPPLPREQQLEFEQLQREAQSSDAHPDTPIPVRAEFAGDINPKTGEQGGPKREPVGRWGDDPGGDWSFKGRVSDF